jgi:hypothetical protein
MNRSTIHRQPWSTWVTAFALWLAMGCDGGGSGRPPCDVDEDCAAGTYCRSGVGCDFECRLDVDCDTGQCDEARGRCVGGGGSIDGGTPCSDALCDDGVYCNGVERCVDGQCGPGEPPCAADECDEAARTCDTCLDPDRDGDGIDSVACGGRDCNDDDPRIPRQEVCDPMHVDEDCDPTSVGSLVLDDGDDDMFLPVTCCNTTPSGMTCGTDCNDTNNSVFPGAPELCDGIDNDCVAPTDSGCACTVGQTTMCGYAAGTCTAVTGRCTSAGAFDCPPGLVTGSETEACDGIDNNCNGFVDDSVPGIGEPCYSAASGRGVGACRDGTRACSGGRSTCPGEVLPTGEVCDVGGSAPRGTDQDCNGQDDVSQGLTVQCRIDNDRDGYARDTTVYEICPAPGTRNCPAGFTANAIIDCNDRDSAAYQLVEVRQDLDADGTCNLAPFNFCTGPRSASYIYRGIFGAYRESWNCIGGAGGPNDCNDVNRIVASDCSPYSFEILAGGHGCPGSRGPLSETPTCREGYEWTDICRRNLYRGGGNCSVSGSPDTGSCTITQTCNGLEATYCAVRVQCSPRSIYY